MKKLNTWVMIAFLTAFLVSGCGKKAEEFVFDDSKEDVDKVASEYSVDETDKAEPDEEKSSVEEKKPEAEKKEEKKEEEKETPPKDGPVSKADLAEIEKMLNSASCNGFLQCEYSKPSDIFWDEVLYNGCDIAKNDLSAKDKELYVAAGGDREPLGSLFVFKKTDVADFVKKMTGEDYSKATHPLNWIYLEKPGLYVTEHGDTNFLPAKCVSGNVTGGIYEVAYEKDSYGTYKPSFRVRFRKNKDGLSFISNEWNEKNKDQMVKDLYDEIIQQYAVAVYEQWDIPTLQSSQLSYLTGLDYENDPMNRIGYYLHDVDKDGINELIIGENSTGEYRNSIYQMYTVTDGERRIVLEGGERDRYYLGKDDTIYNEGSSSASNYVLFHYKMEGPHKELYPIEGVVYEASITGVSGGPYYYTKNCSWDVTGAKPVDQTYFDGFVSKSEGNYADIRYAPLSSVKILKTDLKEPEKKESYSDADLCKMALDHYERETGYRPGISEVDSTNGDLVTIHLYDDMGDHTATSAWYEIDRKTGKGTDTINGDPVDLTS